MSFRQLLQESRSAILSAHERLIDWPDAFWLIRRSYSEWRAGL